MGVQRLFHFIIFCGTRRNLCYHCHKLNGGPASVCRETIMNKTSKQDSLSAGSHNSILKTKITALLLAALLVFSLSSCAKISGLDKERAKAITEASEELRTSLTESFTAAASSEELLNAIVAFADENEIYYKLVNNNIIILVKQATSETTELPEITLHCSISSENIEGSAAKTAALLTALKEAANSSKTTVIISLRDGLFYTGAMALPTDYLETGYLVNVSDSDDPVLFKNSASLDTHRFSRDPQTEPLEGYKSYEISIQGLPRSTPAQIDEEQDDPVLMLYDILSWCEQTHIDYHLSSFKAGDSFETLPQSASLTISIDPTDTGKFQNKVYGMISSFNEKHNEDAVPPSFTMHHIDALTSAVSTEDATDLVGLIYILLSNFDYLSKNEVETTVGRQDFSLVDVSDKSMNFTISCRFMDASKEHDDSSAFQELARLNSFSVLDREIYPRWTPEEESLLQMSFERCAEQAKLSPHSVSTVDILETGVFAMKNPDLQQLAIGIPPESCGDLTKALVLLIENGGQSAL